MSCLDRAHCFKRGKRSQDAASMRGDLLAYEVNGLVAPDHTLMLHFRSNPVVAAEMLTFRYRGARSACYQGQCDVHDRTVMPRFRRWCRATSWHACQYPTSIRRHRLPT